MAKLTAFVAHSFDTDDQRKVLPILSFLSSLRDVGFIWQTAERAEVESVSAKVRRFIDESDVFVGILTARHPVYTVGSLKSAWDVFRGSLKPAVWTTPPWILQEMGYALKGDRDLLIFREPEVEAGGLQGDLEYIRYVWTDPAPAFQRANEMLAKLIGRQVGFVIETVVRLESAPKEEPLQAAVAPSGQDSAPKQTTLGECYGELINAFESKDRSRVEAAYERGAEVAKGEGGEAELHWHAHYLSQDFQNGTARALEELKFLQKENPRNALVAALVGSCLATFDEAESAAEYFGLASSLAVGERKVSYAIKAASYMREVKKHSESRALLLRTLQEAPPGARTKVLWALYEGLADEGSSYHAFAVAELALHENPGLSGLRFGLGLAYHRARMFDLFLHHYSVICEHEPNYAAALHNLGLAFGECGLPILCVSNYKQALEEGETLSASNLGYKYLDSGMADEATDLLERAMKIDGCVPEVKGCPAEVANRRAKEIELKDSKIQATSEHRDYLIALGEALLFVGTLALDGVWKFRFGDMTLRTSDGILLGESQITSELPAPSLAALLGGSREPTKIVEKFRFSGELTGRTCKFEIQHERAGERLVSSLFSGTSTKTEGYIVFEVDGRSGRLVELKEGNPEKFYPISKLETPTRKQVFKSAAFPILSGATFSD